MTAGRTAAYASVIAAVDALELTDDDLLTDRVRDQLARLKVAITSLSEDLGSEEAWLPAWLDGEHVKGSQLYVAAKVHKNRHGAADAPLSNPHSRANLIIRFNAWARTTGERLATYDASTRTDDVVAPWAAQVAAFRADPLDTSN